MSDDTTHVSLTDDDDDLDRDLIKDIEDEADDTDAIDKEEEVSLLEDEKKSVSEEDVSEPTGFRNTDPGVVDESDLDAKMWHKGVGDNQEEEDVEALGFQVVDGSGADQSIDTFGDDDTTI